MSSSWWLAGSAAVALVGVVALSIRFWDWLSAGESGSETIRNIGLLVGGVLALMFATWRSRIAERQANTAQQGLFNERYQKGAEMLGSSVSAVRLGGIYTLKRLAAVYPEQCHVQTMELFCAFVRNPATDSTEAKQEGFENGSDVEGRQPSPEVRVREDVQAVITAIGKRGEAGLNIEKEESVELDLKGANLAFAQLSGTNLSGADLSNANLHGANFFSQRLQAADLSEPIRSGPNQPGTRIELRTEGSSAMPTGLDYASVHSLRANPVPRTSH